MFRPDSFKLFYLYFKVKLRSDVPCNWLLPNTLSLFHFLAKHFILFASMSWRKRTGARRGGRRLGEVCCHPSCNGRAGAKSFSWEWERESPATGAGGAGNTGRQPCWRLLQRGCSLRRFHAMPPPLNPPPPADSAEPAGARAAFRPPMRGKLSTWLH